MIREAVDAVSTARAGALPGKGPLLRAVGFMILFSILHASFRFLARRSLLLTAREVEREVRRRLFSHVIRLPIPFFQSTPTGDGMSLLTNNLAVARASAAFHGARVETIAAALAEVAVLEMVVGILDGQLEGGFVAFN